MSEQLLQRLDALAVKLGVTAQYLWGVLVKQARVEMWQDIGLASFFVLAAIGSSTLGVFLVKDDDPDADGVGLFCLLISLVILGVAVGYGRAALTEGLNPEYWALQQVLQTLSK
jgi:hypothetical protein